MKGNDIILKNNDLKKEYYEWLCSYIVDTDRYSKLIQHLHSKAFYAVRDIPMDENRKIDGIDLRYRFGYENSYCQARIACELDIYDCSILEMILALAIRCDESIMRNYVVGENSKYWFWLMIDNLGLSKMTDDSFDYDYIECRLDSFLNRTYDPDGKGGLFYIENPPEDLRKVQIWYQMNWYISRKYT